MYRHILIATDGSELSQMALHEGLTLAKALGAKATAVYVSEPWNAIAVGDVAIAFPVDEYDKLQAGNAANVFSRVQNIANEMGTVCDTHHVTNYGPAEGILAAAEKLGCDLIVMASHGRRGLSKMLLGSETNKVVTHSHLPVLVCRSNKRNGL